MAKNIFAGVKNSELFELARKYSPEFARHTSKVTATRLDLGWEANKDLLWLKIHSLTGFQQQSRKRKR